jgi:sarcosine oxidase
MPADVIVLGLGGMGSAAACHLARRGLRVLGLERYTAPHDRGASHGRTRVIRQSYYEDPAYVPLLLRAYELWHELSRETGVDLLHEVGGLMMGDPSSAVVTGSLRSARLYGLPHEELTAADIRRRFPANGGVVRAGRGVCPHGGGGAGASRPRGGARRGPPL